MKDDLYFEILDRLAVNGLNKFVDITAIIDKISLDENNPSHTLITDETKRDGYLNGMKGNGHIDFTNVKNVKEALITPLGMKFYYEIIIAKATMNNIKSQQKFTLSTIFVAAVAASFSVATYFKPEPKMAELNKNMQEESRALASIKRSIDSLKIQKASATEKYHKP